MDSTDQMITFDRDGVCDHCNTFYRTIKPHWNTGNKGGLLLQEIVKKIQKDGEGEDFDCIIGMSGGIDSSYLTYFAKEKLGLRPLVFHVDAGWNSQVAVNNIECIVDGLGLDLFTEVINWEEMKDIQLSFFRSGVSHIDTPQDHAFFATMYKFASNYKVKHILTGGNFSTECIRNPLEWMYFQSDSKQIRDIHRRHGKNDIDTFPLTSILWHKVYLPYLRGIRVIRPLDNIKYIKRDAVKTLVDKFDWQPYPQKHFESRFTKFYESYWLFERFGYDVRKVQYSSLILTNQMSREEALEELKKTPYDRTQIDNEMEFVANKLEIDVSELESYFTLPKKTYRDYKNQALIYNVGARFMRLFKLELGGKR